MLARLISKLNYNQELKNKFKGSIQQQGKRQNMYDLQIKRAKLLTLPCLHACFYISIVSTKCFGALEGKSPQDFSSA